MPSTKPSQDFVPLKEVRDGVLSLKDGSYRAILMTSSVNFALKSEEGQASLLFQFQNLLNSLDFSLQIFIESRRLDIKPYLMLLEERYSAQGTDLMRIQTREYIEFIRTFTENTNIMSKSFFVVIPYAPAAISSTKNPLDAFRKKDAKAKEASDLADFSAHKEQLDQRVSVVEQGLSRIGLRTARLGTEEIIELYYKIFNPGETQKTVA